MVNLFIEPVGELLRVYELVDSFNVCNLLFIAIAHNKAEKAR